MNNENHNNKIGIRCKKSASVLLAVLLTLCMLVSVIPTAAFAAENESVSAVEYEVGNYQVTTQGGSLKLRAAANADATVLVSVPNGTIISVSEFSNGYGKTTYDSQTGWLSMSYLKKVADNTSVIDDQPGTYAVIVEEGSSLLLRADADPSGKILARVPARTVVEITEIKNGYGKTIYNGQTGWLSMNYLYFTAVVTTDLPTGVYVVTTDGGNLVMHKEADVNSETVMVIPNGKEIEITEVKSGYGKATYSGVTGWVSMSFLKAKSQNSNGAPTTAGTYRVATNEGNLILRSTSSTAGEILALIPKGTILNVTEVQNGFGKTTYNGKTGWVSMSFLESINELSSDVPVSDNESVVGSYRVTTNGGNLILRDSASASGKEIALVPNGTVVTIYEIKNGYGRTIYDGKTGWLAMSYLMADNGQTGGDIGRYQVTTSEGNLILRADATSASGIVALVPKGTIVTITEIKNGYGKTTYNGQTGWLSMSYLTKISNSTSTDTYIYGQPGTYVITTQGGNLNFRSEPSSAASVYFTIPNGTLVEVTGFANGYGQTTYNGQTGWLSAQYLVFVNGTSDVTSDTDVAGEYKVTTQGGNLILRDAPNSSGKQLALIPNGTILTITQVSNGYGKTVYQGIDGWVSMNYVVRTGDISNLTANGDYKVTTNGGNLILRAEPSASAKQLDLIPNGTLLKITEVKNGYGKTVYNGYTGWVSMSYLTPLSQEQSLGSYVVSVSSGNLILREQPSTASAQLDLIPKGTVVYITEIKNGFGKTTYHGKTGWVSMNYLTFLSTENKETDTEKNNNYTPGRYDVTTNGGNLILREQPSSASAQLALIPNGTALVITEFNGDWGKTTYAGKTGWVSMDWVKYVSGDTDNQNQGYALGKYNVTLTSGNLRLREEPSTNSKTLTLIPNGTTLIITELLNGWGKTTYNGYTGWVSMAYLAYVGKVDSDSGNDVTSDTNSDIVNDDVFVLYVVTNEGSETSIYEKASTESAILGTIPNGEQLYISAMDGDWAYVTYNGINGWVRLDQLTSKAVVDGKEPAAEKGLAFVVNTLDKKGVINLHKEKSIFSDIIERIPNGTILYVQEVSGAWAKVTYNGKTGWILKPFLTNGNNDLLNRINDELKKNPYNGDDFEKMIEDLIKKLLGNESDNEVTDQEVVSDSENPGGHEVVGSDDEKGSDSDKTSDTVELEDSILYGDVDVNGKVDMEDIVLYQRCIAQLAKMSSAGALRAEVTGDGKMNLEDVVEIQRYIAKLITKFVVEK
ncbi:MAG: SH3 domain-containing protein [Clostridiales bacterium]|nr:SH3 domain-containing protein [Clostridiales bacterium]